MKQILLLVAFICVPAALSYPASVEKYPPQCADPTFACQDLENARLCGVVKSCIHDIWSTMNAPDDNDDICSLCKEMVKEARDQLLSNMTQEEIKEVFEGSCKLLPVKLVADACIKIVDEFIPELVEMLASRMDPNMVCTVSGLCNMAHLPILSEVNVRDDLTCEFCTHVLDHVKDLITANTTVEEFRTALLNFCNHTGSFSSKCTDFVNNYFDTIFAFIRNLDSKGFCTVIGLCTNQGHLIKVTPSVKLVPAMDVRKKIPTSKLIPARPYPGKEAKKFYPLVKIVPPMSSKLSQNDIESNDIFAPTSKQLPIERLAHPSVLFEPCAECAFCKAITFYVKQDLKGDRSKENLDNVFANVCSKWVREFPDHCETIMNKYSLHMKHRIHDQADFDDVCFFVDACPIEENGKGVNVRVIGQKNYTSVVCDICKEVFDKIESVLKDPSTKQTVEKLLGQVCNNLPSSLRDECNKFIDDNLDQLFNILEQELVGDNVCPALRLCSTPKHVNTIAAQNLKDIECDLCKDFVEQLQQKLQQPDVKTSLKNLLEKGCSVLPEELSAKCKDFVDQNIDNLINILVQDMDPTLVCSALNLCSDSLKVLQTPKANDIECDICKEIIEKVDEELKDQRTEEKIKEVLSKVCTYLPSSFTDKCENFVNTYSAILISLLAQEMDPQMICAALKLCPDSLRQLKKQKVGDIECELCKKIVQKLDDELKDKTTEAEIKEVLEKICTYFPASVSDKCTQFIETYADVVISLLADELTPSMVCGALKICAGKSDSLQHWKLKVKNLECEGCQYFLHFLQNELMDSSVQERIKVVAKKVCRILPKTYDENCEAYIEEFGSALLAIIAQNIDPSIVCVDFNICPAGNATIYKPTHFRPDKEVKMDKCSLCTNVVDYLDKLLEEDDVDKEITALVEKVCIIVPSSVKEQCTSIIEVYGPYLLQMIGQSVDSKQVCQAIDMCARTAGYVHLLGGEHCTFGPTYWCQSKVHAAACKAEMYCKQKVWQN